MTNQLGTTSRRTFLKASAAASLLPALHGLGAEAPEPLPPWPENGTLIPDTGWRLFVDDKVTWQNDTIYLPEDLPPLADMPVNAPTGGWETLGEAGLPVTLPSTVEQHFWGKYGSRPYTPEEYRYAADDPVPQNGAYLGVSWWYREIEVPAEMAGQRIFLHVRGARLRAEVYLNRQLVGYSILEELPFECNLTGAARPGGRNTIAIRITNPLGRYDWVDGLNAQWGAVRLYRSHGFGGLDRGMTMTAHGHPVRVRDAFVLNSPNPREILVGLEFEQLAPASVPTDYELRVIDPVTGKALGENGNFVPVMKVGEIFAAALPITCDEASVWSLDSPKLYHLRVHFANTSTTATGALAGASETEPTGAVIQRTIPFGFRTFGPSGLGTDAIFRLNGRRIKLYSAISWGFWGLNGLWPTPELALKEVTQAKKLNLNCLNFHRNLAKEDVLRAHDSLGLLRYMEPGGGKLAVGKLPGGVQANAAGIVMEKPTEPADKFAQRYMIAKCVGMVKAFRSHPSVIEYCLQNEIGADLKNPDTLAVLLAMRAEDPSRCIVLNDGFVAPPRKAAQAWYAPWDEKLHRSDEEEWGGWWNQHQGAGDQWYDEFYRSPSEFTYKAPWKKVLTEFGEMEGCATPDNHSLMLHQQAAGIDGQPANRSYDHTDHAEILASYDNWLERWGFRQAFPSTEQLWLSLGKKCYDTWQNYLENARISDELDFAVISGWETTAIENHSGIVDNLRNFKSDPSPIAQTLLPVRAIAKQRSVCTRAGGKAVFDLYLLNDTARPVAGTLDFSAVSPSGKLLPLASFPAPAQTADVFSYLVHEAFESPALGEIGMWRFRFALSSAPANTQTKEIWVTEPPAIKRTRALEVAVAGISPSLRKQLQALAQGHGINLSPFSPAKRYDLILSSGYTSEGAILQDSGETTGTDPQPAAVTGAVQATTENGRLDPAVLAAVRAGTPLLAIPQADSLSDGVARQLADAGAFTFSGNVGDFRAPWMGNWYFVREHPIFAGMPINQAMGIHYAARGRQSNGLLVDGPNVEIIVGYSRDHDRRIGAGTFTCRLSATKVLYHRVPELHPVLQERFLSNAILWLVS